jgi:asparaginyl-tRNA synthetase
MLTGPTVCRVDKDVVERLKHVADTPFKRIAYTEVIELLQKAVKEGHKFENSEIVWGMDLGSEHERYCL